VTAETPAQADEIPDLYVHWYRLVYPLADDDTVTRSWQFLLAAEREFWRSLGKQEPKPAPGTWTIGEVLEGNGDLSGTLHEIMRAYTPGTYAHDEAHAALDRSRAPQPALAAAQATLRETAADNIRLRGQLERVRATADGASAGNLASTPRGRLAKAILSQMGEQ
jgi:hypothetical protein